MSKSSSFILRPIFGQAAEVKFVLSGSVSQVFILGHQLRQAKPDVPVAMQISALPILPPAAWCRINGHGRYGIYCPHILPDG